MAWFLLASKLHDTSNPDDAELKKPWLAAHLIPGTGPPQGHGHCIPQHIAGGFANCRWNDMEKHSNLLSEEHSHSHKHRSDPIESPCLATCQWFALFSTSTTYVAASTHGCNISTVLPFKNVRFWPNCISVRHTAWYLDSYTLCWTLYVCMYYTHTAQDLCQNSAWFQWSCSNLTEMFARFPTCGFFVRARNMESLMRNGPQCMYSSSPRKRAANGTMVPCSLKCEKDWGW